MAIPVDPNNPDYAMTAIGGTVHIARGDAWTQNLLMKITFADPSLKFDFS